jgi:hypothetical protein
MTNFRRVANVRIDLTKEFVAGQTLTIGPNGYTGTVSFSKLRIAFAVQKNLGWATNTCSVSVWNLSQDNRNLLKDFGDRINLSAGYEEQTGPQVLFIGDSTLVQHSYDMPDIVTTIDCGEGDKILNNVRIKVSFDPGTLVEVVIREIARLMGLPIIELIIPPGTVYEYGFSEGGMAKDLLAMACSRVGLLATVQNQGLHILPLFGSTQRPPFLINAETGMIGIPKRYTYKRQYLYTQGAQNGWVVRTTLNPQILPGDKVNIISRRVDLPSGTFGVYSAKHVGDTYGNDWYSDFEVVLIV